MAKYLNANYWKHAYLLEFKLNGVLTDAFTFSVPPESEEFTFPQRKSETKTFGGAVVADYGNDLVQINLSGSTINQELKIIYKSRLGTQEMTGEQEIFYLRDLLKKYGQRDNLQNKEVHLYSLTGGNIDVKNNPKWWKIYVGQLDITRNKDKPFCYNYKFSATGEPEVTKKKYRLSGALDIDNKFMNDLQSVTAWFNALSGEDGFIYKMTHALDQIEAIGGTYLTAISNAIAACRTAIDSFNGAINHYADVVNGIMSGVGDIATDTVMLGDKVFYTAVRFYPTIAANVWNSCIALKETGENLWNKCNSFDDEYFSESSWQTVKELFDNTVSNQDIADVYSSLSHEVTDTASQITVITSKNLNDLSFAVIPGDTGEDDRIIITYGYKVVSITDAETNWDQLAQDYYGDSSLSSIIAMYNNLSSDEPLVVGQSIVIPKLIFAESTISDNEIYNTPDVKDNYGKDLIIKNRDFAVYNGDLQLVSGIDNLEQALLNRYSTLIGARIRLEVYGIQASIGDALNASSSLIQASVHQTTVEDPRVETVEDIQFNGMGDELAVSVVYVDKNGTKQNFGGVV